MARVPKAARAALAALPRRKHPWRQEITLPVPPSANDRLTVRTNAAGKSQMFSTGVARAYKKGIAQLLCFLVPVPRPHDVRLYVVWHMAPGDKGDLDNRLKLTLDALSGHGFDDDRQVAELHVYRVRDQQRAALHVTIEDLTPEKT